MEQTHSLFDSLDTESFLVSNSSLFEDSLKEVGSPVCVCAKLEPVLRPRVC